MRAIVLESYGETDVLQVTEVADPVAGPEEVLVDVVATALNRADLLQRRGFYPSPPLAGFAPPAPEIPGMEFSGRVAAVGERVTAVTVGDEVMGIVGGGAYAERLVVHERQLLAVPAAVAAGRRGRHPRGLDHRLRRPRRPGRTDLGTNRPGPRRGFGRGHRIDPVGQGDRGADRGHRVGREGRGVPGPRCRPGGRLRLAGLRGRVSAVHRRRRRRRGARRDRRRLRRPQRHRPAGRRHAS